MTQPSPVTKEGEPIESLSRPEAELLQEFEPTQENVADLLDTIDALATHRVFLLLSGKSAEQRAEFLQAHTMYRSEDLRGIQDEEVLHAILTFRLRIAVEKANQILSSDTPPTPEQSEYLSTISTCIFVWFDLALFTDGKKPNMWQANDLRLDVQRHERDSGNNQPELANIRNLLARICPEPELVEEVMSLTSGNPSRMEILLYSKSLEPKISTVLVQFLKEWNQQPALSNHLVLVCANAIQQLHAVGATVDLAYQLQGFPTGSELTSSFEQFIESGRLDVQHVIEHFTGQPAESFAGQSKFVVLQAAAQHAQQEALKVSHPAPSLDEAEISTIVMQHVLRVLPEMRRFIDMLDLTAPYYADLRPVKYTFNELANNAPSPIVASSNPVWGKPASLRTKISAHELTHILEHWMLEDIRKLLGSKHPPLQPMLSEAFAMTVEAGVDAPRERMAYELPTIQTTNDMFGTSALYGISLFEQAPRGLALYDVLSLIETKLRESQELTEAETQTIVARANDLIQHRYEQAYGGIGLNHSDKTIIPVLLNASIADGLVYVGQGEAPTTTKLSKILAERFSSENFMETDAKYVLYHALYRLICGTMNYQDVPEFLMIADVEGAKVALQAIGLFESTKSIDS